VQITTSIDSRFSSTFITTTSRESVPYVLGALPGA
jgi:hypothetical protein